MKKILYLPIVIIFCSCFQAPLYNAAASMSYMLQKEVDSPLVFQSKEGNRIEFGYSFSGKIESYDFKDQKSMEVIAHVHRASSQYDGSKNRDLKTFTDFRQVHGNLVDGLFITQNLTQCDEKDYRVDFLFPNFDDLPEMNHLQLLHYNENINIKGVVFEDVFASPKEDLVFKKDMGLIAFVNCNGELFKLDY